MTFSERPVESNVRTTFEIKSSFEIKIFISKLDFISKVVLTKQRRAKISSKKTGGVTLREIKFNGIMQ